MASWPDSIIGRLSFDGSRVEVDAAVIAIGIDPALGLAEDLGLTLGERGVLVDQALSVFYLSEGRLEAVLSINDGGTIRHSHSLIRHRKPVDARLLGDPEADLSRLGGA
jgi:NADPH-dependent 2,4-dienoyl-CoA reductase/sulfur reductase-like enzyme